MFKIKKGDIVQVMKGKDSGKRGRVLNILASGERRRALVEGLNLVKKHKRQGRQDEKGGIISIEAPIDTANLMLFCKNCQRPGRVGFSILKDRTKVRFCKGCKEPI